MTDYWILRGGVFTPVTRPGDVRALVRLGYVVVEQIGPREFAAVNVDLVEDSNPEPEQCDR